MNTQMTALCVLLLVGAEPFAFLQPLGIVLLWLAALLTVVTGYAYLKIGLRHMDV